jgi:hypothetical protein
LGELGIQVPGPTGSKGKREEGPGKNDLPLRLVAPGGPADTYIYIYIYISVAILAQGISAQALA